MNAKLDENLLMAQSINNTAMLGLVGKQVTVEGNGVSLSGGQASETRDRGQRPRHRGDRGHRQRAAAWCATYPKQVDRRPERRQLGRQAGRRRPWPPTATTRSR